MTYNALIIMHDILFGLRQNLTLKAPFLSTLFFLYINFFLDIKGSTASNPLAELLFGKVVICPSYRFHPIEWMHHNPKTIMTYTMKILEPLLCFLNLAPIKSTKILQVET